MVKVWLEYGRYMVYTLKQNFTNYYNNKYIISIMAYSEAALFENIHQSDPLQFWSNHGLDYRRVSDFLEFDTNELSKIGGVSKQSVRLDARIPQDLKDRLEQIANICALVAEYFGGDAERTALWFKTPNPLLGAISPRDMIRYGRYKKLLTFISEARRSNAVSGA